MSSTPKHICLISQVYIPDPTSVGQHMADVAVELVRRGWRVTVLTSAVGYDDPKETYPLSEIINGVEIRRVPYSSFGKKTIAHRLAGQFSFSAQVLWHALRLKSVDVLFVTTSPPTGGFLGAIVSKLKRVPMHFWVMDLNPDQAIEQGVVGAESIPARVFDLMNRCILKQASSVIALDEFMAERLQRKGVRLDGKLKILPPWPMEDELQIIEKSSNPFIKEHDLEGKLVLMYSGNHSPVHPLSTILEASKQFTTKDRVVFAFIGGGQGKAEVEKFRAEHPGAPILSLPYQPLDQIKFSLSAGDIHFVSIGAPMVGCVHPCKFYGAMALAKPVVLLGPSESHIGKWIDSDRIGWQIDHGKVQELVSLIRSFADDSTELTARGSRGKALVTSQLGKQQLTAQLTELITLAPDSTSV